MEIPAKLMEYRYHFTVAITVSLVIASLSYAAPSLVNILAYFWPLFASTAAFLILVIAFGGLPQLSTEGHDEKVGEGLIDYVTGRPQHIHDHHKHD